MSPLCRCSLFRDVVQFRGGRLVVVINSLQEVGVPSLPLYWVLIPIVSPSVGEGEM